MPREKHTDSIGGDSLAMASTTGRTAGRSAAAIECAGK